MLEAEDGGADIDIAEDLVLAAKKACEEFRFRSDWNLKIDSQIHVRRFG